MPSTPPSWRALETTADAVAYRPPGTAARLALPSSGRVAPTPMPLSTWPGSHSLQNAGSRPDHLVVPEVGAGPDEAPGTTNTR